MSINTMRVVRPSTEFQTKIEICLGLSCCAYALRTVSSKFKLRVLGLGVAALRRRFLQRKWIVAGTSAGAASFARAVSLVASCYSGLSMKSPSISSASTSSTGVTTPSQPRVGMKMRSRPWQFLHFRPSSWCWIHLVMKIPSQRRVCMHMPKVTLGRYYCIE